MTHHIDVQVACDDPLPVCEDDIRHWAEIALAHQTDAGELTIRLASPEEIRLLNNTYRKNDKPTNVLAFPANLPKEIQLDIPLLGDVIICPAVLEEESKQLNKPLSDHWAHIVIHGVLHLLGYDHIKDEDAQIMQPLEAALLAKLGIEDPYINEEIERG